MTVFCSVYMYMYLRPHILLCETDALIQSGKEWQETLWGHREGWRVESWAHPLQFSEIGQLVTDTFSYIHKLSLQTQCI